MSKLLQIRVYNGTSEIQLRRITAVIELTRDNKIMLNHNAEEQEVSIAEWFRDNLDSKSYKPLSKALEV